MSLSSKVAIVTGGGQGIGKATALRLASEGCAIAVCGRNSETINAVVREIELAGGTALGRTLDISNEGQVKALVCETIERFGRLDIMVCNAGVRSTIPFDEIDDAEWYRVLDINLKGTFYCCRAAFLHMRQAGTGRIVNISSIAGRVGGTLVNAPYSISKAGIINLTKVVAKLAAPYNVTVNCIAAGTIDTPFIEDYDDQKRVLLESLIPLKRMGTAEDIAAAVVYFASDGASWVTGVTLDVNGGQVMQ